MAKRGRKPKHYWEAMRLATIEQERTDVRGVIIDRESLEEIDTEILPVAHISETFLTGLRKLERLVHAFSTATTITTSAFEYDVSSTDLLTASTIYRTAKLFADWAALLRPLASFTHRREAIKTSVEDPSQFQIGEMSIPVETFTAIENAHFLLRSVFAEIIPAMPVERLTDDGTAHPNILGYFTDHHDCLALFYACCITRYVKTVAAPHVESVQKQIEKCLLKKIAPDANFLQTDSSVENAPNDVRLEALVEDADIFRTKGRICSEMGGAPFPWTPIFRWHPSRADFLAFVESLPSVNLHPFDETHRTAVSNHIEENSHLVLFPLRFDEFLTLCIRKPESLAGLAAERADLNLNGYRMRGFHPRGFLSHCRENSDKLILAGRVRNENTTQTEGAEMESFYSVCDVLMQYVFISTE
ncbi:Mu-like phage minor tail protein [Perkinsela sp. CCAP 1560/4]|nr:Mu-like phage minor tail protein [Perkinsela sp. CCAP 1560/4]|eukprot:KNH04496.1 Mu-like phage minor tail protein [Perkinsela sp. CCAP 1560/4]